MSKKVTVPEQPAAEEIGEKLTFSDVMQKVKVFFIDLACGTGRFFRTIFHNKKAFVGMIILLVFIFIALFGELILPYAPRPIMTSALQAFPGSTRWERTTWGVMCSA